MNARGDLPQTDDASAALPSPLPKLKGELKARGEYMFTIAVFGLTRD